MTRVRSDFNLRRRAVLASGFLILWFVILLLPAAWQGLRLERVDAQIENRQLAEFPSFPHTWAATIHWPSQMDAYLNDHFGWRQTLIAWNNRLRYYGLGETASPQLTLGKHQTLFFTSHDAAHPQRMRQFLCGKGVTPATVQDISMRITGLIDGVNRVADPLPTTLAFVPTKPILYAELLPAWMQAECVGETPTIPAILQQSGKDHPSVATALYYPLAKMLALKYSQQLYPKLNFHWHGRGAQVFAQDLAEHQWQLPPQRYLQFQRETITSDLQRFMPGVELTEQVENPDYLSSQIDACLGPSCFTELRSAAKLTDVSRYRWKNAGAAAGKKMLLISDSFGNGIAGYFSPYFSEVWHVSINNSGQLSEQELDELRADLIAYAPHQVLYLLHDYSASCLSSQLGYCPIDLLKIFRRLHPVPHLD